MTIQQIRIIVHLDFQPPATNVIIRLIGAMQLLIMTTSFSLSTPEVMQEDGIHAVIVTQIQVTMRCLNA